MELNADILSPNHVADFLLFECRERGDVITNLKLQKLLFYAQAWYLALNNRPLFNEDFQAWVHGPALPSQYRRFKEYEWRPILAEIMLAPIENPAIIAHLKEVVDVFGVETASALEMMTHSESPWIEARAGIPVDQSSTAIITKQSMKSFYKSIQ